jgi:ribonucleoside-diphosphate reductase alpha chain
MAFAPSGLTDDPEVRTASSIVDYIFRRLALTYLSFDDRVELGLASLDDIASDQTILPVMEDKSETEVKEENEMTENIEIPKAKSSHAPDKTKASNNDESPICYNCGNQTQRSGNCYVCTSCGSTTGCS